jgi:arabinogalactan oligomer/maltooligosaccharide transport system substrate-binding protein
MSKKLFKLISLVLIAVFALAACAPATTPAPAATAAPKVTEVTFWHSYGTGSAEEVALAKVLAAAKTDLTDVKINVLQVPFSDIFNKYRTDVAAGGGPDMFIAPNDSLGDDARAKLLADITDLIKGKLTGVSQLGIDGMSLDGKIYGVPESMKAVVFWYDKSKLAAAPKTTDDLLKLMQGGTPVSISYGCYHHYGFFEAFGGKIFDDKWKVIADQGTGVADAMTYLNSLYQISKKNAWPKTDSDGLAPFTTGKVVAITNGNWAMGDYKAALKDNLALAPLPAGPKGPAKPMLGVDGFYINPNSKNKDAALKAALYLTNAKSQTTMMNDAGHVPVRTDVTITDPLIKGLVDAFNVGATIRPQVTELGKYWSNFCGTDEVFEKGTAAADWVKTATAASNK